MLLTSDGRAFVFAVFAEDGCECADLQSLHSSQDEAEAEVVRLKADPEFFGPAGRYSFHKADIVVECWEVQGQCRVVGW